VAEISVDEVADAVRYVAAAAQHVGNERLCQHDSHRGSRTHLWPWAEPQAPRSDEIAVSGLFDLGWYVVHHPELESSPIHPIDHYLLEGAAKGFSPSSTFDFKAYQEADEQMVRLGTNPLLHYIDYGQAEGRRIPMHGWDGAPGNGSLDIAVSTVKTISALMGEAESLHRSQIPVLEPSQLPKTFAFYLPQFHPIAENNWAHGMGFSEWHNVIKAKPLFRGHYQPRIPGELGFYDLRSEEVPDRQIHLAQEHGISGFCFYYYSFNGRKLLYKPIENFLKSHIDAPFMCVWANENWTKRWDGGDREVIIAQHHSDVDDLLVLGELIPLFSDTRYVKIKGRPVFMVYKPHLFPDIRRTVDLWRQEIVAQGFSDIYLVMVDDWKLDPHHPREIGFDASYEIPSNIVPSEVLWAECSELGLCDGFDGRIVDYVKFARYHMSRPFPGYTRFRTVMLPWDNTPRYGLQAIVHLNGHGDAYKLWVLQALLDTYQYFETDERLVFLHSWNEWCEGTYLEPDSKYGRFFLDQTREAVETAQEAITSVNSIPAAHVAAQLLKLQKAKDSGAFQVMHSTRMQVQYACAEVSTLRSHVNQLEQDRGRLNHDNAELRSLVESIYNSKSWRVTAPLRSVWDRLMGWSR
jgi:hypothetical protein